MLLYFNDLLQSNFKSLKFSDLKINDLRRGNSNSLKLSELERCSFFNDLRRGNSKSLESRELERCYISMTYYKVFLHHQNPVM